MGLFALWECFAMEVKGWGHAILLTVTSLRMLCRLEPSQRVDNLSYRIDSWHLFPFFGAGMRRSRRSVLNVEQLPPPDPRLVRSAHPSDDVAFQNLVKIMHSDKILLYLDSQASLPTDWKWSSWECYCSYNLSRFLCFLSLFLPIFCSYQESSQVLAKHEMRQMRPHALVCVYSGERMLQGLITTQSSLYRYETGLNLG